MPNAKPAILLVHGAWHLPSAYDYLVPHLAKAGYEVERVTLPSVSTNTPLPDKSQDVAAVRASIQSLAEADKDVVLVVHSYGGIPGSDAAEGMAKEARAATGKRGGIVHIVYLTAFVCAERECLVDAQRGEHADFIDFHDTGLCTAKDARYIFYNDVYHDVADKLVAQLRPHSSATMMSPQQYAAWKHIPSTYLICTIDNAISPKIQERMVAQDGAKWSEVVRLRSGHSPMVSMPEETARIIRRAAGEKGVPETKEMTADFSYLELANKS